MPKTVVITGASSGLGRATAHAFAARGDSVALLARGEKGLAGAAAEVEARGGRALVIPCDVADAAAVEAAAAQVDAKLGRIDVWVNNAMVGSLSRFLDMEPDEYQRITDVTYVGVVNGTRAALKRFVPADRGVVVQVGSSLAYRGIPLQAGYCGAKHAIQGFTESVRCELLSDGSKVHLTMVQMPALNTPQFSQVRNRLPKHPMPVPPVYEPEVGGDAIVWASDQGHARLGRREAQRRGRTRVRKAPEAPWGLTAVELAAASGGEVLHRGPDGCGGAERGSVCDCREDHCAEIVTEARRASRAVRPGA